MDERVQRTCFVTDTSGKQKNFKLSQQEHGPWLLLLKSGTPLVSLYYQDDDDDDDDDYDDDAGTVVRDPQHRGSSTHREQDLNLRGRLS